MSSIFDKNGMMIFPNPLHKTICESKQVLIVKECYCPNGHNLINRKAMFGNFPGILLKIRQKKDEGLVALSPVYGDKSKISLNIELIDKEILEVYCSECEVKLPIFSKCECGADLVSMFLTKDTSFKEVAAICTRVNCFNSQLKSSEDIISKIMNV